MTALLLRQKSRAGGRLEHFADAIVGTSRTLQILVRADLLADIFTL